MSYSYKIFRPIEYSQLVFYGKFFGNSSDIRKGYICMCQNHQQLQHVIRTKYYCQPIVICKIDNHKLTPSKLITSPKELSPKERFHHLFEPLQHRAIINTLHLDSNINDNSHYVQIIDNIQYIIK
jgi:uncharacterized protein (DUF952 family)